jgi:hypothetical protein
MGGFWFLFGRVGSTPGPSARADAATRARERDARARDDDGDARDGDARDDDEAFGVDGGGAWEGTTRDDDDAEGWWGDARARDGARERWRR